jgi:SAM-dependent methyltransferase
VKTHLVLRVQMHPGLVRDRDLVDVLEFQIRNYTVQPRILQTDAMRLNLGSGPRAVRGWTNIDRSPNVFLDRLPALKGALRAAGLLTAAHMVPWDREILRHDIRKLPYPDRSVESIYSSHTLEHLYLADAEKVLRECYRLLKPGGTLRLALPDAEKAARDLVAAIESGDDEAGVRWNRELLAYPFEPPSGVARMRALSGGHTHRWQPTAEMVITMLRNAGFPTAVRCQFKEGRLFDVARIETRSNSFFIEAYLEPDS